MFVASVFSGMGVLVARFAGANDPDKVNRTVYQAFLTAVFMAVGVLAPIGYFLAPTLLDLINAAPGGAGRGAWGTSASCSSSASGCSSSS